MCDIVAKRCKEPKRFSGQRNAVSRAIATPIDDFDKNVTPVILIQSVQTHHTKIMGRLAIASDDLPTKCAPLSKFADASLTPNSKFWTVTPHAPNSPLGLSQDARINVSY